LSGRSDPAGGVRPYGCGSKSWSDTHTASSAYMRCRTRGTGAATTARDWAIAPARPAANQDVRLWLATWEAETVWAVRRESGDFPENLVVRLSAAKIDGEPPKWPTTSTVVTEGGDLPRLRVELREPQGRPGSRVGNVVYLKH